MLFTVEPYRILCQPEEDNPCHIMNNARIPVVLLKVDSRIKVLSQALVLRALT